MKSIDFLEHGGGHMHVKHDGKLYALRDPRQMHYQEVLACLHGEAVPGDLPGLPYWKLPLLFDRWRAAWDLPDFQGARRLAYLVDHYRSAMANDLIIYAGLDLGELWRARRWTLLLDVVDRLPSHSHYSAAVSMDEEHAKLMADALAARKDDPDAEQSTGPALTTWTPEVAVLTSILDGVRAVQHAVVAVNSPKGKAPDAPKPSARPVTPLERAIKRAQYDKRKAAHDSLVARVLPHKR